MTEIIMTLHHRTLLGNLAFECADATFHAIYVMEGSLENTEAHYSASHAFFAQGPLLLNGSATILHFSITAVDHVTYNDDAILSEKMSVPSGDAIIRLDQVTFPAGARAYRHVHPGPGIRFLVSGELEIKSDHETAMMNVGSAWFEEANSPVQATAADVPETAFIRVLLLPVEHEGKPTIKLLNPNDEALPKRQTNKRFFDQRITL